VTQTPPEEISNTYSREEECLKKLKNSKNKENESNIY